jgi:hypothetical protein
MFRPYSKNRPTAKRISLALSVFVYVLILPKKGSDDAPFFFCAGHNRRTFVPPAEVSQKFLTPS